MDGSTKIKTNVEYPLKNLDLTSYVTGYAQETFKYNLYGVCFHFGTIRGGHYTSVVHDSYDWIHYNDHHIQHITENEIMNPNAYCLFYERI
jgi:ubiquitin C-terminal hydrolase